MLEFGEEKVVYYGDSGIGITWEECEKIWERFYCTAVSQKIAKESGVRTTFLLYLPLIWETKNGGKR
jgi:hypothetical protein